MQAIKAVGYGDDVGLSLSILYERWMQVVIID